MDSFDGDVGGAQWCLVMSEKETGLSPEYSENALVYTVFSIKRLDILSIRQVHPFLVDHDDDNGAILEPTI